MIVLGETVKWYGGSYYRCGSHLIVSRTRGITALPIGFRIVKVELISNTDTKEFLKCKVEGWVESV